MVIELTKKLICTCCPTLVLTKGTKAHQRKVSSARLIVYTAHFIRAGLDFQDRVPILSVLGLPLDMVRARVKFWSGTDGAKSFTRLNLSVPNQFFWYAYFFHPSRAKNFLPCKWGLTLMVFVHLRLENCTRKLTKMTELWKHIAKAMRTGEVRNINLSLLIEFEPFPSSPIAVCLFLGG